MSSQKTKSLDVPLLEPFPPLQLAKAPVAVRYGAALIATAIAALMAIAFDSTVQIPNISLIFVIPVIVCAVTFGLGSSLCAAILGALAYNFFLTEPRYSLHVEDPANVWAIGLLFVVGCIASAVASTARRRADDAALLGRQAAILQVYGRQATAASTLRSVVSATASALDELFHVPVVVMHKSDADFDLVERRGNIAPIEVEMEAARSSLASGQPIRGAMYPYDTSRFDFWPVATSAGEQVVIGLAFDPGERPTNPETPVEIVASVLALVLDRRTP